MLAPGTARLPLKPIVEGALYADEQWKGMDELYQYIVMVVVDEKKNLQAPPRSARPDT